MNELNIPSDVFDPDDIESPLDPISEPVRMTPRNVEVPTSEPERNVDPAPAAQPRKAAAPRQATTTPRSSVAATASERRRETVRRETVRPASNAVESEPLDLSVDLSFFTDGRFTKLVGIALLFTALFCLVVSISFFSTGALDQSAIDAAEPTVENVGGVMGALVANAFISQWLGVGSFAIIFLIGALGVSFVKLHRFNIVGLTIKSLISAIAISVVAGYLSLHFTSHFSLGGDHGHYINTIVRSSFGEFGVLLLSLLLLAMIVVIFLKEATAAMRKLIQSYKSFRSKVASENRSRQVRQREAELRMEAEAAARAARPAEPAVGEPNATADEPAPQPIDSPEEANPEIVSLQPTDEELKRPIVIETSRLEASAAARATTIEPEPSRGSAILDTEDFIVDDTLAETDSVDTPNTNFPNANFMTTPEPAVVVAPTIPTATVATAVTPSPAATPAMEDFDDNIASTDDIDPDLVEATPQETDEPSMADNVMVRTAPEIATVDSKSVNRDTYDPTAELSHYRLPSLDILNDIPVRERTIDLDEQEENKQRITATLNSFGIGISRIEATIGPTVTLYEIVPAEGVRISKIKNLENDIARSIAAIGTRIIAPIPGKETVGIEVPNKDPQIVPIKTILSSEDYQNCTMKLPMAMGATISNKVFIADLTKMPHLLVAGATGMGKSVGLNTIIASLLYKKHPAELKFVLVDPKMVEFSLYKVLEKHYLAKLPDEEEPIITDPSKVVPTLNSLCVEMDKRYELLKSACVRQIGEYNQKFISRRLNPNDGHRFLPYIVVVVDEFADLIITAGKEVEQPIARIAAKARAVGIHLILATQRPSTNVITGLIKANFPGRIAFRVFQMVDSRTILDHPGANQLIGRGDMLFSRDGVVDRVQCALIETDEVERLCEAIASQQGYFGAYELPEYVPEGNEFNGKGGSLNDTDPLFPDAARYVATANQASTTSLQRHYEIGYPRAGKIMDQLEKAGVVGPAQGSKPRSVLMDILSVERLLESMNLN